MKKWRKTMKKYLWLLTIIIVCVSLVACGNQTPPEDNLTNEDDTITEKTTETEDESEIEIKIDYIAEKLGLTDESDVMYGLIGAVAGKQYCNGNVELYQFDENSQAYKDLIGGKSYLTAAAYKDGVVLVFALGVEQDTDLVDAFNALDF